MIHLYLRYIRAHTLPAKKDKHDIYDIYDCMGVTNYVGRIKKLEASLKELQDIDKVGIITESANTIIEFTRSTRAYDDACSIHGTFVCTLPISIVYHYGRLTFECVTPMLAETVPIKHA